GRLRRRHVDPVPPVPPVVLVPRRTRARGEDQLDRGPVLAPGDQVFAQRSEKADAANLPGLRALQRAVRAERPLDEERALAAVAEPERERLARAKARVRKYAQEHPRLARASG